MKEALRQRENRTVADDGSAMLPRVAADHLRAAFEQMDLLLRAEQEDAGLPYLVSMVQHLRAVRQFTD